MMTHEWNVIENITSDIVKRPLKALKSAVLDYAN